MELDNYLLGIKANTTSVYRRFKVSWIRKKGIWVVIRRKVHYWWKLTFAKANVSVEKSKTGRWTSPDEELYGKLQR